MLPQRRQSPTTGIARELFCKRTSRPHWRPIGNILNVYLSIVSAEPWSKEAKGPHRRFLSNMFGQSSQLIGSIYLNLYMYTRGRASEGRAQSLQLDSSPHGLLSECFAWSGAATVSLQNLLTNASAAALMDSSVCSPTLLASSCVRCPVRHCVPNNQRWHSSRVYAAPLRAADVAETRATSGPEGSGRRGLRGARP